MFTGGLAEVPTKGAVVGPTFACLLGRQMYYYKTGKHFPLLAFLLLGIQISVFVLQKLASTFSIIKLGLDLDTF